jgi:hypothetical protein
MGGKVSTFDKWRIGMSRVETDTLRDIPEFFGTQG